MITRAAFALAFFGIGLGLAWHEVAKADGALAIGVPERGPRGGFTWGAAADEERDDSKTNALKTCRGEDPNYIKPKGSITEAQNACRIVATFKNQCAAVAYNGSQNQVSTAFGWAIARDSKTAVDQAIAHCESMRAGAGLSCHLSTSGFICDGSGR